MVKPAALTLSLIHIYLKNTDYVPRKEPASRFAGGKVALFDRIDVVNVPDAQTAVNALRQGERCV